jgi:hypothetical protein
MSDPSTSSPSWNPVVTVWCNRELGATGLRAAPTAATPAAWRQRKLLRRERSGDASRDHPPPGRASAPRGEAALLALGRSCQVNESSCREYPRCDGNWHVHSVSGSRSHCGCCGLDRRSSPSRSAALRVAILDRRSDEEARCACRITRQGPPSHLAAVSSRSGEPVRPVRAASPRWDAPQHAVVRRDREPVARRGLVREDWS